LDKADEIVGVVLPANEDPALPLNLTFCGIFARLYPSPIYSPREHTLVCWSKPCPYRKLKTADAARSDAGASRPIGGGVGQSPLARHCLALRSCTSVIPLARAIALACAKPSRLT
jgi:hypothetical protein